MPDRGSLVGVPIRAVFAITVGDDRRDVFFAIRAHELMNEE
jgi:hypothetical protein